MTEQADNTQTDSQQGSTQNQSGGPSAVEATREVKLSGLLAFKIGMSRVYDDNGKAVPVTVLKYEPCFVTQLRTVERDGYEAVQVGCQSRKASRSNQALRGQFKKTPFEHGARFVREFRQSTPDGVSVGQKVDLNSLAKGDQVKVTAQSKGHGFSGVVRRWGFAGGSASHGSKFHRAPGSIGNCEFPGRVMPGRKMPGQYGNKSVTVRKLEVVDVIPEEGVLLVKGAVPGGTNNLVKVVKEA